MNFVSSRQISFESLDQHSLDLIIASSGYESRSINLAEMLNAACSAKKVAMGFAGGRILSRFENDQRLIDLGYELIDEKEHKFSEIENRIKALIESKKNNEVEIFIDYSSMSRDWFAGVLHTVRCSTFPKGRVKIYFGYSHATFGNPTIGTANAKIGPIKGFSALGLPSMPTALIIGLGFEAQKALGVKEYIDPAETFIFYTDPATDERFVDALMDNNKDVLGLIPAKNIFNYPADDMLKCSEKLSGLCVGLAGRYRVILAPLGPKPFSLLCMIISLRLRNIEVWRVSSGELREPVDRVANGDVSVIEVCFEG